MKSAVAQRVQNASAKSRAAVRLAQNKRTVNAGRKGRRASVTGLSEEHIVATATTLDAKEGQETDEKVLARFPSAMRGETVEEDFDPVLHTLQSLDGDIDQDSLEEEVADTDRALDIVNRKLSDVIIHHYSDFVTGMDRVNAIQTDLTVCTQLIRDGRANLELAEQELVQGGITILHKLRQKQLFNEVIQMLLRLKALTKHEQQVLNCMETRQFAEMIEAERNYRAALPEFKGIESIEPLSANVKECMQALPGLLDEACGNICQSRGSDLGALPLLRCRVWCVLLVPRPTPCRRHARARVRGSTAGVAARPAVGGKPLGVRSHAHALRRAQAGASTRTRTATCCTPTTYRYASADDGSTGSIASRVGTAWVVLHLPRVGYVSNFNHGVGWNAGLSFRASCRTS